MVPSTCFARFVTLATAPLALAAIALAAFVGCDSGSLAAGGKTSATAATATAATTTAPSSASPRPSVPAPRPQSSAVSTRPTRVTLQDGGSLQVPAGTIASPPPKSLPSEVTRAHKFQLGGAKQLLLLNEMDLAGKTCAQRLDLEWDKLQRSRADADPERLKVRRVAKVVDTLVAGHRVLYSEAQQTARGGPDNTELAAPIVTAMMCPAQTLLVFMYAGTTKRPASEVHTLLMDLVKSYKPKP